MVIVEGVLLTDAGPAISPGEDPFDRTTRLVHNIFGGAIALVSLIEGEHQAFRSVIGPRLARPVPPAIPLRDSLCRTAFTTGEPFAIDDTRLDPVLRDNPYVTGFPNIRAYAGVPLVLSGGQRAGVVSTIHRAPRPFTERDIAILRDLAAATASELELREQATIDPLTGTLNRRAFLAQSERLMMAGPVRRRQKQVSVILFDLDRFKCVNDRFGHMAGGEVPRALAPFAAPE